MITLIIITPLFLLFSGLFCVYYYDRYQKQKNVILLSKLSTSNIIDEQNNSQDNEKFTMKLIQAGTTLKEYKESRFLFILIALIIGLVLPPFLGMNMAIISIVLSIVIAIFGGEIFLYISKAERVGKIEKDLGIFLDLINVILEAGGGLKNAFFKVSQEAKYIIDDELLKEISILEYEMSNYSTKQAYENLKNRVDSRELDKIVDFLLLNEETGIGVKNIFSSQSDEMRQKEFYRIKGKANTLSLYLMLVIFVFILPTLGAFIVFPLMEGKLNLGL